MGKLQELHVSMLPNGYDVKIGKKSMLYFNEQELLEGLFVHIGLKIDDYMNKADHPRPDDRLRHLSRRYESNRRDYTVGGYHQRTT